MEQLPGKLAVYRSSAGSGKTYTLTKIYLSLALQSPDYFRHILAVTFTNKATQEMKSRIIATLDGLSRGKYQTLAAELGEAAGVHPQAVPTRAQEVLSYLLHEYSHFSVSTIDSFFQKVIRAFAREIGLQGGFTVELDQYKVLGALVDQVLESLSDPKQKQLRSWLVNFASEQLEEGANWDIRRELETLGREIFQETYKQQHPIGSTTDETFTALAEARKELVKIKKQFENTLINLGTQALFVMEEAGVTVDDFKYKGTGAAAWLARQAEGVNRRNSEWSYLPKKRVQDCYHDMEQLLGKNPSQAQQEAAEALHPLLVRTVDFVNEGAEAYQTVATVLRYFYSFGILSYLDRAVARYRDTEEVMLISDANDFLQRIIDGNDTPFIYEKVGAFYQHYLIDEFQDTSAFQWLNLRPLVLNSLAEEQFNLVVGDVKQSIYRWRGGDWRLLLEGLNRDVGQHRMLEESLATNYRSLPEIIHFNNAVFAEAPALLERTFADGLPEGAEGWETEAQKLGLAYADAYQLLKPDARYPAAGYARVEFLSQEEADEASMNDLALAKLPGWLEELQTAGFALRDVAFLVRTKREGQLIADFLLQYQGEHPNSPYRYDVISSEALALDSAPAVRILLYALAYLHQPEDPIVRAQLVYEYQQYVAGKVPQEELHEVFYQAREEQPNNLPEPFVAQQERLSRLPLFDCVEALIPLLGVDQLAGQFAYLQGFQDAVLDYTRQEQRDLGGFLEWWNNTGKGRAVQVPEQLNAARILTIHKSKGLQYKAVLIPFAGWALDHRSHQANFLWVKSQLPALQGLGAVPVRYTSRLAETEFKGYYHQERMQALLDNLNLLYVAFTRAEEVLWVAAPQPKTENKVNTAADLLWNLAPTLAEQEAASWEEDTLTLSWGEPFPAKATEAPEREAGWQQYPAARWRERLRIRHTAEDFFHLQETGKAATVEYGTMAHRLLALIHTADQVEAAVATLKREGQISGANPGEQEAVVALVKRVINLPAIRDWFTDAWTVKTEVPILPKSGELKRLDRVMIQGDRALVVDFKTGLPHPNTEEQHRKQVSYYTYLLKEMGYTQIEGYLMYLQANEPIRVR